MPTTPRRPAAIVPRPRPRPATPAPAAAEPGPPAPHAVAHAIAAARDVTPALRREAEALLRTVLQRKARIGADFYEIGQALIELLDRKLFAVLGHATFTAMLEERRLMSSSAATRLIAICRAIPRHTALQLGPERAFEWLLALRVQAGPDAGPADLRRLADGAPRVAGRPVADMSTREIADLRRRMLERRAAARADPGTPEAHRIARALAQRLRHMGAEDATVVARHAGGDWRIRADLAVPAAQALLRRIS